MLALIWFVKIFISTALNELTSQVPQGQFTPVLFLFVNSWIFYFVAAVLPTECGDGRPSDTEELLRPDCDPPPTTPPLHHAKNNPQTTPEEPKRELNFEVGWHKLI
jgi:hypothetical protein